MMLLGKVHIGEVQASLWSKDILDECRQKNIPLL
jgi:aspartate--ammonia ligase